MQDRDIVSGVVPGDEAGLDLLYVRYAGPLKHYARRLMDDEQEAEDLVHEAFVKFLVMVREGLFDPARGTVQALCYRIVRNLCLDRLRQARATEPLGGDEAARATEAETSAGRVQVVARMLEGLPDKQRRALLMRVRDGLSYQDIACRLQATLPQVKVWIFRARQALRTGIDRAEERT